MSLLENCSGKHIERSIYLMNTLGLEGNPMKGYPFLVEEESKQVLVINQEEREEKDMQEVDSLEVYEEEEVNYFEDEDDYFSEEDEYFSEEEETEEETEIEENEIECLSEPLEDYKNQEEIQTLKSEIEHLKSLLDERDKHIANYKQMLAQRKDEQVKIKQLNEEVKKLTLENKVLKLKVKELREGKEKEKVNEVLDYDKMSLKELAKHVKNFMLENGCRKKPVDKHLLVAKFGATNVNRLVVQRFLILKNDGYIL